MFERYSLFEIDKLRDRYLLPAGVPKGVKPSYNISPTQLAPVVIVHDGTRVMESMKWGFIRHRAKDANAVFRYKTFIAKSEDMFTKDHLVHAAHTSRCLIPVNGFYVWRVTSVGKQAHYVRLSDQGMFTLAGVYSSWQDPSGKEWGTFAVVTTRANQQMSVLSNRMPLILDSQDEAAWLDTTGNDTKTIFNLMRPYDDDKLLEIKHVSPEVLNTKVDSVDLIRDKDSL
jgi:putative SOS response-associated peptidase YedK